MRTRETAMTTRLKFRILALAAGSLVAAGSLAAQQEFIPAKTYSAEEDREILKLYERLRVADVSDGLDMAGLQDVGLVDPEIRPLWRDVDNFAHIFAGIAVTVRYVPSNRQRPDKVPAAVFEKWEGDWYGQLSSEPFTQYLREGSVVVIDGNEDGDTGTIGSNNIMGWKVRGAVGVVTSGGARDTDEIIKEKIPLYYRRPARGIRPGRNLVESVQKPVTIGGVLVRPGDVVVADGDGVVVVPREFAKEVAGHARRILEKDKQGRRKLYEKLGLPPDQTVQP